MDESTVSQEPESSKDICASVESFEDIDLIAMIAIVWKHKYLILAGSFIPTIAMALILYFSQCNFSTEYIYSILIMSNNITNESTLDVFRNEFYGSENIDRVVVKLKEEGLETYASLLNNAGKRDRKSLESLILFRNLSPKKDTNTKSTSTPVLSEEDSEILSIKIIINAPAMQNEMPKISKVIRDSFEKLILLSDLDRELVTRINDTRLKIVKAVNSKSVNATLLKSKMNYIEKLREIAANNPSIEDSRISLQFNIGHLNTGNQSKFLPLPFQILAEEVGIIQQKDMISANEETRQNYEALIAQCTILLSEIRKHKSSVYTIEDYRGFVSKLAESEKDIRLNAYMLSHLYNLDCRILSCTPVTEFPQVEALAKGTVKKSGIVFVIFFGVFGAIALVHDSLSCRRKAS